jgi:hypothetical protein
MYKSTHGSNLLDSDISVSSCIVVIISLSDSVDFAVGIGTMVVSQLSFTWDMEGDLSWMPRSDTSDLSATTMGLTLEHLYSPSLNDTLGSLTFGNSNSVNKFVWLEYVSYVDLLLEFRESPIYFGVYFATIDLNFHNVCFLESEFEEFGLGVGKNTYNRAVFLDTVKSLTDIVLILSFVLGESLVL